MVIDFLFDSLKWVLFFWLVALTFDYVDEKQYERDRNLLQLRMELIKAEARLGFLGRDGDTDD